MGITDPELLRKNSFNCRVKKINNHEIWIKYKDN